MKKITILLFALLLTACEQYPNTFKACVNYMEYGDQYCGTGFFIESDEVVTAAHIIDKSEDNILTAVGPGENETFFKFHQPDESVDMLTAIGQHEITNDTCPICPNINLDAEVIILGNPSRFRAPDTRDGILRLVSNGKKHIYIEGSVPQGFSGGPIIDVERSCVIGSVIGQWLPREGWTKAANLVELLN